MEAPLPFVLCQMGQRRVLGEQLIHAARRAIHVMVMELRGDLSQLRCEDDERRQMAAA